MSTIDSSVQVVIVTGANRGLGLGFTHGILSSTTPITGIKDDAYVIATARNVDEATDLHALQQEYPQRLHILPLDLADEKSINNFVTLFKEKGFDRIDVLINNAGFYHPEDSSVGNINVDVFNQCHLVNAIGPIKLTNALTDIFKNTHVKLGGSLEDRVEVTDDGDATDDKTHVRIVYISSMMSSFSVKHTGGYGYRSSKLTLNMLASMYALDNPCFGVVILHPGWVETRMGGQKAPVKVEDSVSGCITALNKHGYASQSANKLWSFDGTSFTW